MMNLMTSRGAAYLHFLSQICITGAGIVSRDWGRLQMVYLDRSEVLKFKIHFSIEFF
jgi:hypothetical protein